MRAPAILVIAVLVGLTGCGSSKSTHHPVNHAPSVKFVNGAFDLHGDAFLKTQDVLGVKVGTSAAAVRSRFGRPLSTGPADGLTCWLYPIRTKAMAGDHLVFCMNAFNRVSKISVPAHG
jgi:hypothetical protein